MKVSYQGLVKVFRNFKKDNIPVEDWADALDIDSDQEVDYNDILNAIDQVTKEN